VGAAPKVPWSHVDISLPPEELKKRHPRFYHESNCREVHLQPGECLYLPALWYHAATQIEPEVSDEVSCSDSEGNEGGSSAEDDPIPNATIALNMWVDMDHGNPYILHQLAREVANEGLGLASHGWNAEEGEWDVARMSDSHIDRVPPATEEGEKRANALDIAPGIADESRLRVNRAAQNVPIDTRANALNIAPGIADESRLGVNRAAQNVPIDTTDLRDRVLLSKLLLPGS